MLHAQELLTQIRFFKWAMHTYKLVRSIDGRQATRVEPIEIQDIVEHYQAFRARLDSMILSALPFDIMDKLPFNAVHSTSFLKAPVASMFCTASTTFIPSA